LELSDERTRWLNRPADDYVLNYLKVYREILPEVQEWKDETITALLLFAPKKYDAEITKELDKDISYFRFAEYGVDIQIVPERKGDGVKAVLSHLGIDKKYTMGIGDDHGDIDMFDACEIGVAMGNGKDEVKEKSDFVTKTIDKHGVKYALKKFRII
jgi:hydroxymethylpyrimidine pyrophosphatase-like HAD family hydrolase